ncbi:protein-export membrane protein SecD [Anaplasma phagocytophilum str. CRT53-1]|uniref:Protein translocase subunit SecD n=1 Tax=Anaplasma phagocytophilum str. CRT53-1 TaxID=1359157 RepID=A0A0F3PJW5_ANAPH|nr:protein translocase subunit SecD [Anaplasma phagocytophilum]KJV80236.1 protein-export membrane protein SecD [Anaplasma phagocytophilum str. CRT53-1]
MQLVGKAVATFLLCALSIYFVLPNFVDSKFFVSQKKANLGLDLRGGTYLLLEVDFQEHLKERLYGLSDELQDFLQREKIPYDKLYVKDRTVVLHLGDPADLARVRAFNKNVDFTGTSPHLLISFTESYTKSLLKGVIDDSTNNILRRLDKSGTKEITIKSQGENKISLQVPGVHNVDNIKSLIGKTAKLTFHLLEDVKNLADINPLTTRLLYDASGNAFPVMKRVEISGDSLVDASAGLNSVGRAVVYFKFDSAATKKFADITKQHAGKPFAAVLDNVVLTAPVIREPILGGNGEITGRFDLETAKELAILLKSGALPAPLNIIEERVVGPSLGARSIEKGRLATISSIAVVSIFVIMSYGVLGLFAVIGLVFNIVFVLLAMTFLGATLTLPGIAGITLTVGMSIDANVLIFERIREEMRASGKLRLAVERGFKNAMSTIFDSNMTTLIVAVIMLVSGSTSVQGFAATLGIGILCSMLSAVVLTKVLIDVGVRMGLVSNLGLRMNSGF